jgi:hypothetical protein
MKKWLVLATVLLCAQAQAITCPFTEGKAVAVHNVEITPEERYVYEEVTINVTIIYLGVYSPLEAEEDVAISYYKGRNITKVELETDDGIAKFTPEVIGYHLVETAGRAILINVSTRCRDGICGGTEDRYNCVEDCASCGDWECDSNEDLSCPDCAVCGDGNCTIGENRTKCVRDCLACGDGICDWLENRSGCPEDCPSGLGDGYCDGEEDGTCDSDCELEDDPDCKPKEQAPVVKEEVPTEPGPPAEEEGGLSLAFMGGVLVLISTSAIFAVVKMEMPRPVRIDMPTKKRGKKKSASAKST